MFFPWPVTEILQKPHSSLFSGILTAGHVSIPKRGFRNMTDVSRTHIKNQFYLLLTPHARKLLIFIDTFGICF